MIRVYAFVSDVDRLPALAGVDGAPLERHDGDVVAIVSRHDRPAAADPRGDAVAHGLVVEALAGLAPAVLPVRFGETFRDDEALDCALRARSDEICSALARVRGCVEVGVRVAGSALERGAERASTGRAYMATRLALLAERDAIVHELHERLDAAARASVQTERGAFDASYLVERVRVGEVRAVVDRFAASHPELTVVCTGPWAPYSFGGPT
jgi:hypothetical protein